ncbi:MAG: DUF1559 domain-containing protein [Pirellulaceae bacterium]|nr:DUF1559 domain-containing protein [Pirellulaceae bacterium]
MPIAYACPHCGKQFSVAEQFAGQSGPCAGCGQTITVPRPAFAPPGSSAASGAAVGAAAGMSVLAIVLIVLLVFAVGCGGILVALLLPAVQAARTAARRAESSNNLRQIALAVQNYHDTYQVLPPAVVTDASGKPLYSGRVLLLPFLEQGALYDRWNKDEAWDGPNNRALSESKIITFSDPSAANPIPGQTDYLFLTGAGTLFEPGKFLSMPAVLDGTSNTILAVEVKDSGINWAEPRDIDLSQPTALPASHYPVGNQAAFLDGHIQPISKNMTPEEIRALATRAGAEPVSPY